MRLTVLDRIHKLCDTAGKGGEGGFVGGGGGGGGVGGGGGGGQDDLSVTSWRFGDLWRSLASLALCVTGVRGVDSVWWCGAVMDNTALSR